MDYVIFENEYEKDCGWVDIFLVKRPPNGLKGFIQLKEVLGLDFSAAKLYQNAKNLPYMLIEKAYFGRAEFLVATLENPEIVEIVKRKDAVTTVKVETCVPKEELMFPNLPDELGEIINLDIKLDAPLPFFYGNVDNFYQIQAGYRFNPVTGDSLISDRSGGWRNNWYVFATNDTDDPFYIDLSEKEVGYPVYFSFHGAGNWTPIKVTETLAQFKEILVDIHNLGEGFYYHCSSEIDIENEFWLEVDKLLAFDYDK